MMRGADDKIEFHLGRGRDVDRATLEVELPNVDKELFPLVAPDTGVDQDTADIVPVEDQNGGLWLCNDETFECIPWS